MISGVRTNGTSRATGDFSRFRVLVVTGLVAALAAACSGPEPALPPPLRPAPPLLVATHGDAGILSVIDTASRSVVGTIRTGTTLGAAILSGSGERLFVVVPDGIMLVNVRERRLERTIRVPGEHTGIALADNRLFVVQTANNKGRVLAIDLATERVVAEREIDDLAKRPDVTTDGSRLYVPHSFYSGRVTILDTRRLSVLGILTFEDGPTRVRLSPDERTLFVPSGSGSGGQVTLVDTVRRQTVANIPVDGDATDVAITRDGQRAVVPLFGGGAIAILDIPTRAVTRTIPVEGYPIHVALGPDDKTAYVLRNGTNQVWVVDLEGAGTTVLDLEAEADDIIAPGRLGRP
jgi:DNA-binding beta-propeller fold protein YncE